VGFEFLVCTVTPQGLAITNFKRQCLDEVKSKSEATEENDKTDKEEDGMKEQAPFPFCQGVVQARLTNGPVT
jgi:hypothetical protein